MIAETVGTQFRIGGGRTSLNKFLRKSKEYKIYALKSTLKYLVELEML